VSTFYAGMAATALKLLTKFGAPVTLYRVTGEEEDPVTGDVIAGSDVSVITTGLIKPYADNMIGGSRILSSDRELILSSEHEPLPDDRPIVDGEKWSIIGKPKTVKPDGTTAVAYFVQVRR